MDIKIDESWKQLLKEEFEKEYFLRLTKFIKEEYSTQKIFPSGKNIFKAFDLCPVQKVKVVILGQDPYHTPGVANGLAFSANADQRIPPSLLNIYKEIKNDLSKPIPNSPDLSRWAKQGVLLLNATLSVRSGSAGSHQGKGWEEFTDSVIHKLVETKQNLVFILWGAYARKKGEFIPKDKHYVIESPHPSPFSADKGFFGSKPFSKANEYLKLHSIPEIDW